MFLQVSVILSTGGGLARRPPRLDGEPHRLPPPGWKENPPWLDGEPPLAGWRTPPAGWRTPWLDGEPPQLEGEPPREADSGIRSTIGQYASYWNAFLFWFTVSGYFIKQLLD